MRETPNDRLYTNLIRDLLYLEGLRLIPYKDSLGFPTVGIGHKITHDDPDTTPSPEYTIDEVLHLFAEDLSRAVKGAKEAFLEALGEAHKDGARYRYWTDLPHSHRRVLILMSYQLGTAGLKGFRKFLAALVRGEPGYLLVHHMRDSKWYRQTPKRVEWCTKILLGSIEGYCTCWS